MTSVLTPTVNRLRDAAAWRVRRVLGDARVDSAWVAVAKAWRPTLKRPVFIGVTGSAGKTTTKELLLGILSASKRGVANPASLNVLPEVAKTLMRVRPSHDFCVVELSEAVPGVMAEHLGLLKPSVGIVTVVQDDHLAAFGSVDGLAEEMSRLVEALPASGTAVLNADDPRVLAMSAGCHCKVLTYGVSPQAHLRAQDITSAWPDRLQMTLLWQGQRVALKTQLCGTHWLAAVLGSVGGALASGLTLQDCVTAMANVASFEGRMQPITTPDGITFIRDDFKAPLWTLDACFDFMKAARAKRKIIVIGTLSDYGTGTGASKKYADVARLAQETADITLFVGPWASSVLKTRKSDRADTLRVYTHVHDAAQYLNSITQAGDLVLLKGTNKQDHLVRIILARTHEVNCWRDDCARVTFCNECPDRMKPSGMPVIQQSAMASSAAAVSRADGVTLESDEQIKMNFRRPTTLIRLRGAIAWRLHRVLGDRIVYGALLGCAERWRAMLRGPTYIGVIGSAGKTTAKELLLGMLAHKGRGVGNPGSFNNIEEIAMAMLRLRPWHSFFVSELSEDRPGVMDRNLALLRPTIGIVTVVKDDHLAAFASRDALAAEMAKLVTSLPATGTAVLNADDERVLAMAALCAAKVITFGISSKADLRADDISSVWPDRLQMTLVHGAQRVRLATQLCGTHWIPSVLGAIGGGLATGMTLEDCAAGIATVTPFEGRMQSVTTPDGITFIRDDFKAPLWTLDACFDFMKAAQAKRKIIVIGELSDIAIRKETAYRKTAILCQEVADITVFVGPWASSVLKARKPDRADALRACTHVRDAAQYLNSITQAGDLVLLKGTNKQDHLYRIILARSNEVNCWRDDCQRPIFCNVCPDRMNPAGTLLLHQHLITATAAPRSDFVALEPDERVIVGLGNPEAKYSNTPHNIGYAMVNLLAETLGLEWIDTSDALVARGRTEGRAICLVKVHASMNVIGAVLKQLSERMSFTPVQCILVYDDLDLPLGTVRTRLSGSAGGHRGVASILEAFQTDAFRRVKVGLALPGQDMNRGELVLSQFDAGQRGAVDAALELAQAALHALLKNTEIVRKR